MQPGNVVDHEVQVKPMKLDFVIDLRIKYALSSEL